MESAFQMGRCYPASWQTMVWLVQQRFHNEICKVLTQLTIVLVACEAADTDYGDSALN